MPADKFNWESLLIALSMITLGSTLTALLKPQETLWQSIKKWLAGIIAGLLVKLLFYANDKSGFWFDMVMIALSTFITTIYPVLEAFAKAYAKKYTDKKIKENENIT